MTEKSRKTGEIETRSIDLTITPGKIQSPTHGKIETFLRCVALTTFLYLVDPSFHMLFYAMVLTCAGWWIHRSGLLFKLAMKAGSK